MFVKNFSNFKSSHEMLNLPNCTALSSPTLCAAQKQQDRVKQLDLQLTEAAKLTATLQDELTKSRTDLTRALDLATEEVSAKLNDVYRTGADSERVKYVSSQRRYFTLLARLNVEIPSDNI